MPQPRRPRIEAAETLAAVAPLLNRWIERLLAGHEPPLTVTQFLALRAISRDGISGSQLAHRAGVSGPAVSQLLTALLDAGLIERREDTDDRRRHSLELSAAGVQALASAKTLLHERLSALLAELPRPEADALSRALPKVEAILSGAPPPRRPPHRGQGPKGPSRHHH